jgi:hypothetical protein
MPLTSQTFDINLTTKDIQILANLAVGTVSAANAWWAINLLELSPEDSKTIRMLINSLDTEATRLNGKALENSILKADVSIESQKLKDGLMRVNETLDEIKAVKDALKGLAAVLIVITQIAKTIATPTVANIGGALKTISEVFN